MYLLLEIPAIHPLLLSPSSCLSRASGSSPSSSTPLGERILAKQRYLAGNVRQTSSFLIFMTRLTSSSLHQELTIADLPLVWLDTLDNTARPNVARWCKEIQIRPAWKAVKEGISSVDKY
ncbi:hypothetical protein BDV98DRAFT_567772 [Pterulicium gracile]|uniref:GST C-terminal domain-containing protein n=1 Tax=Pterulicium gracile TaxID=1884261 RepID=A0A5C3QGV2_9AGAR|nr:hypothetical protein BDV98DRAFT_567772 [Pterula gracilis]